MKREWKEDAAKDAARVFFQQVGEQSIVNRDVEVKRLKQEVQRLTARVQYFEHLVPECAWPGKTPNCPYCAMSISCKQFIEQLDCTGHTEAEVCDHCDEPVCEDCIDTCHGDESRLCTDCFDEHAYQCKSCCGVL